MKFQPVTEDDASPRKKRVQVKKHRKKTPDERGGTTSRQEHITNNGDGSQNINEQHGFGDRTNSNEWSDDEEDMHNIYDDDETPKIVFVSSFDHLQGDAEEGGIAADFTRTTPLMANLADTFEEQVVVVTSSQGQTSDQKMGTVEGVKKDVVENIDIVKKDVSDKVENMGDEDASDMETGEKVGGEDGDEGGRETPNQYAAEADNDSAQDSKDGGVEHNDIDNSDVDTIDSTKKSQGPDTTMKDGGEKDSGAKEEPQIVSLAPKLSSIPMMTVDNTNDEHASRTSPTDATIEPMENAPDIPPLTAETSSPKSHLSPRPLSSQPLLNESNDSPFTPVHLPMPDLSDDESDDEAHHGSNNKNGKSIFRSNDEEDEDEQSITGIQGCGPSVTKVTSNMDEIKLEPRRTSYTGSLFLPYQSNTSQSGANDLSDLGAPIPMSESYKSAASSNVSYFSYEDISIASDDLEMCAICICPYEEGDIRIFSKRCPHGFHKECILEWLAKSHSECPCCRIDMVTKTEIKETSASLLGTERLAQALAVVNGPEMQEAPPFRRALQRSRLARQMLARAQRRRSAGQTNSPGDAGMLSPQSPSPNAHWLWSARFNDDQSSAQSVSGTSPVRSSLPALNEGGSTPRANNVVSSNMTYNRHSHWLSPNTPSQQPRTINPSRSSDAIMNPHETHQTEAVVSMERASALPNTNAGSLFSSLPVTSTRGNSTMYHNHWHSRTTENRRRNREHGLTMSPTRRHIHWHRSTSNSSHLPVTMLPSI